MFMGFDALFISGFLTIVLLLIIVVILGMNGVVEHIKKKNEHEERNRK